MIIKWSRTGLRKKRKRSIKQKKYARNRTCIYKNLMCGM